LNSFHNLILNPLNYSSYSNKLNNIIQFIGNYIIKMKSMSLTEKLEKEKSTEKFTTTMLKLLKE